MRISDWSSDVCSSDLLTAAKKFPQPSGQQRFYLVDTPVSYLCNPAAGSLRRNAGYPISAAQPTNTAQGDRKSVVSGKRLTLRGDLGGPPILDKNTPQL